VSSGDGNQTNGTGDSNISGTNNSGDNDDSTGSTGTNASNTTTPTTNTTVPSIINTAGAGAPTPTKLLNSSTGPIIEYAGGTEVELLNEAKRS